jgi:hemoglobin-like flavoprotein
MSQTAELLFDVYSRSDNPLLRATLGPVVADPSGFARRFYAHLFARAPGLRRLFPDDMSMQEMKLVQTLGVIAAGLEEPERIIGMLEDLGARHRGYGVKFAHYVEVGEALLDALAEVNGPAFNAQARAAWQRLYTWISQQMRRG